MILRRREIVDDDIDLVSDPRLPPKLPDEYMAKPRRCTYFEVSH